VVTYPDRTIVKQLCVEALEGEITLDDFYARRPSSESRDRFLEQVLEDLEDGILHTPGRILRGGVDRRAWERSPEYFLIYLDSCLLDDRVSQHTSDDLLDCRAAVQASLTHPTKAGVKARVERCLARQERRWSGSGR
jgi:hypothetical protein